MARICVAITEQIIVVLCVGDCKISSVSGDVEEVEKKWRKRYIERFGNPNVDDEGEKIEETETIKIGDLFEERGGK